MTTKLAEQNIHTALTAPLSYAIVAAAEGKSDRNRETTFTIWNTARGSHITFRVRRPKGFRTMLLDAMIGTCNETDFEYVGSMNRGLWIKAKEDISPEAAKVLSAIQWTMPRIKSESLPSAVEIHHSGSCCCCGRKLTNPESLDTGIGPICGKRLLKNKKGEK